MSSRQFYQAGWFKWLAGFVIVLILVPLILRPVLVKVLVDNGFEKASIEKISINWFTGVVAVESLALEREGQPKLSLGLLRIDLDWLALLKGELSASSAEINDVTFAVVQQPDNSWDIVAPIVADSPEAQAGPAEELRLPKFGLRELTLRNVEIQIDTDYTSGSLVIDDLVLQRLSSWQDRIADLKVAAKWNGAPISIDLGVKPFEKNPELKGNIRIEGLDLGTLQALLPAEMSDFGASLMMDMNVTVERDDRDVLGVDLTADVSVADINLKYRNLALALAQLSWNGDFSIELEQDAIAYQLSGDINSEQLSLQDHQQQMDLVLFESLALQGVQIDQQQTVSFEQLLVTNISAVKVEQAPRYWLNNKQLKLDKFNLQLAEPQPTLSLASFIASEVEYNIVINKQGGIQDQIALQAALKPLLDSSESEVDAVNDDTVAPKSMLLSVAELHIDNSVIAFQDQRFKKPYNNELHIDQLLVSQLDQARPEQLSPLHLQARLGEFSTINFTGNVAPFAPELAVTLAGEINSVPLPEISPYAEAYLGYQLMTGHYDHKINLSVANNALEMKNNLKLRRLVLKSTDKKSAEKMTEGLDVPLPLALSMLRDRNDVIDLDMPLKGDLDDFNVGVGDILNTALVNALQHGSMSYLQLALQPYGAAIMAADLLVDQVGKIRFEPVLFVPGSLDLEPQAIPYIEKLQAMLAERQGLSLSLCGRSSEADQQVLSPEKKPVAADQLDNMLLKLASDRAKLLKRQFVDAGIKGGRLYLCKPAFDQKAVAGVVLSM